MSSDKLLAKNFYKRIPKKDSGSKVQVSAQKNRTKKLISVKKSFKKVRKDSKLLSKGVKNSAENFQNTAEKLLKQYQKVTTQCRKNKSSLVFHF